MLARAVTPDCFPSPAPIRSSFPYRLALLRCCVSMTRPPQPAGALRCLLPLGKGLLRGTRVGDGWAGGRWSLARQDGSAFLSHCVVLRQTTLSKQEAERLFGQEKVNSRAASRQAQPAETLRWCWPLLGKR